MEQIKMKPSSQGNMLFIDYVTSSAHWPLPDKEKEVLKLLFTLQNQLFLSILSIARVNT
jgi:hypothetical protein